MTARTLPQSGDYHELLRPVTLRGDWALWYAEKSIPVFPCKPGGKEPLIRKCPVAKKQELTGKELAAHARTCERDGHGHHDATTDPERIRAWWSRWPDANVAKPTGKRSGELVMDVDPEHGGYDSLAELHEEGHELPLTATNKTGGGGVHHRLRYPAGVEIRNSAGKLGPGLDIRGEGGYVILPPSVTEGPYEVLHDRPLADAPEWLIERLTGPSRTPESDVATIQRAKVPGGGLEGPEIGEGERNTTLYKIACSLRARGHGRGEILEALERVNRERCSPPLAGEDLSKIAKSAARHAPGNASPEVTPEVLAALDAIEADIMRRDWPGVGGKSARDTAIALVRLARIHGTMIPAGVRLSVDVRSLALMASVSKSTLLDNTRGGEKRPGAISRLKMRGVIRSDNATRFGKDAGAFVLLTPRATVDHSTTHLAAIEPRDACGPQLRSPLTAPRLRWSRPVFAGLTRVGTISRMGKTKGEIIDHLEDAGGTLTVASLVEALGVCRVRDLRRRHLEPLADAGVVECSGDAVSLTSDWLDALNERRDQDGEIADHRRDIARYQRERDAYRNRDQNPSTPHPANRGADGYVEDLETLPPTPTVEVLYPLVNTTVNTVRGPGRLWQVFSDRVGVVLEGRPEEVTFMHPSELVLGEVAA